MKNYNVPMVNLKNESMFVYAVLADDVCSAVIKAKQSNPDSVINGRIVCESEL